MVFKKQDENILPFIALAFGILCIGFSAIFVKIAAVPGQVSAFYRFFIAGIILIPWWLMKKPFNYAAKDVYLVLLGGVLFAIDLLLWNTGILITTAATATLLANNAPVWVGLGALFFFKEKLSYKYWVGLFISLFGMTVLLGFDAIKNLQFNTGDILSILASFFYAAYLLTIQRSRSRLDTVSFMSLSLISSIITMFIYNIATETPLTGFSSKAWFALLGMGLISHLGGWLAINYALGHLRAASVSISLLSQSVITAVFSVILLGEYLSFNQIVGGILVLMGIYFVNRRTVKQKK